MTTSPNKAATVYNKMNSVMVAAAALREELIQEDTFPKGEDFRGTNDALVTAAMMLLRVAANHTIGDSSVAKQQYHSAKVLLELVDCDTTITQ